MLQSSQASSPLQFLQSDAAKPRRIDAQALEPVLIKVSTNPTVAQGLAQIIEEEFAESEDELENTLGQSALETLSLGRGIAADVGRLV